MKSIRLCAAVLIGLFLLIAVPPSAAWAKNSPSVQVDPIGQHYSDESEIRASVRLVGATSGARGTLYFDRYSNDSCSSGKKSYSTRIANGNSTVTSSNLIDGSLGRFWLRVTYAGDANNNGASSLCSPYQVVKRSSLAGTVAKAVFDTAEKIPATLKLSNVTGDASGTVTVQRYNGATCAGPATVAGSSAVSHAAVAATVELQDNKLGPKSFTVQYTGDNNNAQVTSPCKAYSVGAYVRGKVFADKNSDGLLDSDEPGIGGVKITLMKGPVTVGTMVTSATGAYEFFITEPGSYKVTESQPDGYGSSTPDEYTLELTGSSVVPQNFGERKADGSAPPPSPVISDTEAAPDTATTDRPLTLTPARQNNSLIVFQIIAIILVILAVLALIVLVVGSKRNGNGTSGW